MAGFVPILSGLRLMLAYPRIRLNCTPSHARPNLFGGD